MQISKHVIGRPTCYPSPLTRPATAEQGSRRSMLTRVRRGGRTLATLDELQHRGTFVSSKEASLAIVYQDVSRKREEEAERLAAAVQTSPASTAAY